jgi:type I restriction enzyme M protein
MPTNQELEQWGEAQDYPIQLDKDGKIVDFLDPDTKRENAPEERIRQRMVQVLHFELNYPKNLMALERTINLGRERKRADIVVYTSPEARASNEQGQIHLISETKSGSASEPDGQLISYISGTSASGGFWTNGTSIVFYRKDLDTGLINDWLGIPKYGLAWDSIGHYKKTDLISPIDLKTPFRRCHNAIYRAGIDSEDVALDMVRIILAKVEDESSGSNECQFHITPEEYKDAILRKNACNRIRSLFDAVKSRFPDVFNSHEEITASDDQLAIVISYLQPYAFLDTTTDIIGTAYEVYVASHLKGERGQYFTNRLVVNMMVRMLNPSDKDVVLDPACGSGGFLIASMNYIFGNIDNSGRNQSAKDLIKRNVCHNLFGVDTTPKLVKVAKANMLLNRDGHTGIVRGNSLAKFEDLPDHFTQTAGRGKVDMVLTNPPFGAGYELRIKEPVILGNFKTGRTWNVDDNNEITFTDALNSSQGVAPEVLFLERCIDWIKPGGTIGIVMAKGQVDNREALAIRRYVFQNCKVLGVVNLHEDTFQPFVGAKASVIFLQKKTKGDNEDYRIFMAISNKIGQTSRGEPIFKRDTEGNPIIKNNAFILDEDLTDIAESYHKFLQGNLEENPYHYTISKSEINPNTLSLNPVHYLPANNAALQYVLSLADSDEYEIHTLSSLGNVFNGARFKRPYADFGVTEGEGILKYFTGTALTQLNSDNIKYLDSSKANRQTRKHLEGLQIFKGYILISDSGTLGRVTYALSQHDGHIATNNLIRVVIEDLALRGYVYQFLKSPLGQRLMLKNAYGTNQEHLEPDVIAQIPIPIPKDRKVLEDIGLEVIKSITELENSIKSSENANNSLGNILELQ